MALPEPPYGEVFAVAKDRLQASRWPDLIIGKRWLEWFGTLAQGVDQAPVRRAKLNLSGQTASLAITPLPLGELPAGIWRVSYHARVTTPASVSSSLEVTISWTDGGVSQSATGAAMTGNLTTTVGFGTLPIRIDADTPVSVATIYASTGAQAMIYRLDVVLESLALDGQP